MAKLTLVQAVNDALKTEMRLDDRVVVMGEDVGVDGGVFRATLELIDEFGEERVVDTPLAESGIVGTALGMAVYGLRPVGEIQFSGFMPPAYDQIISHVARIRWRSRGRYQAPMVIRAPYGGGIRSPEHHAESPETYYAHIPGLKVVIPSSPYDAKGLLISAIRDPDPVVFLEPKKIYRAFREEVPEDAYTVPIGEADVSREGADLTLVSWGYVHRVALEAAEMAETDGIDVEVIDLRTLNPPDHQTVIDSVARTGRCVVAQEAHAVGGFGSELAAVVSEATFFSLQAPIERVTGFDVTIPLGAKEDLYIPDAERVHRAIRRTMDF